MDALKEKEQFKTYKPGDDLSKYLKDLVTWVEKKVYDETTKRVNWIVTRQRDGVLELTNSQAIDQDGNWRLRIVNDDLQIERRIAGTWTKAFKISGS
jgi:uncharacterized membrane-anchored protein